MSPRSKKATHNELPTISLFTIMIREELVKQHMYETVNRLFKRRFRQLESVHVKMARPSCVGMEGTGWSLKEDSIKVLSILGNRMAGDKLHSIKNNLNRMKKHLNTNVGEGTKHMEVCSEPEPDTPIQNVDIPFIKGSNRGYSGYLRE